MRAAAMFFTFIGAVLFLTAVALPISLFVHDGLFHFLSQTEMAVAISIFSIVGILFGAFKMVDLRVSWTLGLMLLLLVSGMLPFGYMQAFGLMNFSIEFFAITVPVCWALGGFGFVEATIKEAFPRLFPESWERKRDQYLRTHVL